MKSFKGLISKIQKKSKELEASNKLKKKLKVMVQPGALYSVGWWG